VPVFDSAVALNTAVMDYEICVLKPLFNQEKQAATVAYVDREYQLLSSGNNGNPYWVVRYYDELGKVSDKAYVNAFQGNTLSGLNAAFNNPVKTALVRGYVATTRSPQSAITCPYQGDLNAVLNGTTNDVWGGLDAVINPACSSYSAYTLSQSAMMASVNASQNEWVTRLNWNNGIYDVRNQNGDVIVPGIFLNAVGTQALTSGFRQLENANDIGQMVSPLFAGMGNSLLSSGLNPNVQISDIQHSINNAMTQQQNSLANAVVGTALTNLYQLIQNEQQYNNNQQQLMATALNNAITQLRTAENRCWALIIPKVCSTPLSGGTCTGSGGANLTVATSTNFSNIVISRRQHRDDCDDACRLASPPQTAM
jgi:hypothetical protein